MSARPVTLLLCVRARRVLLAAVLALLCAPATALAHAQLQQSSPGRDAIVGHVPKLVSFTFDEAVGGSLGAVRVYDSAGKRVDAGDAFHPDGRGPTIAVGLKPGLAQGTYTATYRVVSADTHIVTGGVVFSIGKRAAGQGATVGQLLSGQETGAVTADAFTAAKAVQYAAIGLGGGLIVFLIAVWLPTLTAVAGGTAPWQRASERFLRRLRGVLVLVAAVGVISALVAVVLQGAEAAGVSFAQALHGDVLRAVWKTRFGAVWTAAAAVWLLTGVAGQLVLGRPAGRGLALSHVSLGADGALLARPAARAPLALVAVPLLALIAVPAAAGHASVQHPVWLFLPANLAHVAAMSVWLGGLAALVLALPPATRELAAAERTHALSAVLQRFSPLALTSVVVLLGTGTIQALVQIDAWSQLLHTAYGRTVVIKIGLLVVLIGLGALNRQRTLPRLRAAARAGATPGRVGVLLRRTLRLEVGVVAVVLVMSGALSGYAPAKDASTGPVQISSTIGPAQLSVDVEPAQVGANELHVYLFDTKSGAQYAATKELTVTAELPAKGIGPLPLTPQLSGPGHYTIGGAVLGAPGVWQLHLTARVSDFDQYERTVSVRIR